MIVVPTEGFEPPTVCLQGSCSTVGAMLARDESLSHILKNANKDWQEVIYFYPTSLPVSLECLGQFFPLVYFLQQAYLFPLSMSVLVHH